MVWRRAYTDWKAAVQARLVWTVVTAIVISIIAAIAGVWVMPGPEEIGASFGIAIAAILYILWFRFRAPAKIWTENRGTIESLERQLQRLEATDLPAIIEDRLRMEIGSTARRMAHEKIKRAEELVSIFEKEVDSEDFRHATDIRIIAKLLPEIPEPPRGYDPTALANRIHKLLLAVENRISSRT